MHELARAAHGPRETWARPADRRKRADGFGDRNLEHQPIGTGRRGVELAMKWRRALIAGFELIDRDGLRIAVHANDLIGPSSAR